MSLSGGTEEQPLGNEPAVNTTAEQHLLDTANRPTATDDAVAHVLQKEASTAVTDAVEPPRHDEVANKEVDEMKMDVDTPQVASEDELRTPRVEEIEREATEHLARRAAVIAT